MTGPTTHAPTSRRHVRILRGAARTARAARRWRPQRGWRPFVGVVLAGVLVALLFGVTTASVEAALGPHVTRYDVTTDATVTVDFGPLGTLQVDSPLPATLGVRATVKEIPADVTELGQARTLEALSEDLSAYVAFFSGPAAAVQDVAFALVRDAALRSVGAFAALLAGWLLLRRLLGPDRRHELVDRLAVHARPLCAAGLAVVLGGTVLTSSVAPGDRPQARQAATAVFEGTPLAGARVTGRLGGVIDTYGTYAVDAWRQNEDFYRGAQDALVVAWQDWENDVAHRATLRAQQDAVARAAAERAAAAQGPREAEGGDVTVDDEVAEEPSAADGADASGADVPDAQAPAAPPGTATPSPSPRGEPVDPVVLVVVSDLHCNVGMAPLIGRLAELADADAVLDAGDTTMNGTSVEQYCVTSFARAVPSGVALVTSPGNHDSRETTANYARAGATVLDGSVVEVAGVRILGDSDASATRVGAGGTASAGAETPAEAGRRLADVACDDGDVDLLLIHTPAVGEQALDTGCVPAQVSGHYHRRLGPEQVGLGVRYVSSSTAGATLNQPTVGPLRGVAEMTVLRFDPVQRRVVEHQLVRVAPDGSVTVDTPRPWPRLQVPGFAPDVEGGPTVEPTADDDVPAGDAAGILPDGILPDGILPDGPGPDADEG
ncbi:metallophosphoesterase [Cellulomonas flavigena DSM 20109]|uniref:Metallophosphoesterase n=1 Tax=Cellulomonas flavigena (strain ATCC 482 / DSM 20109 / BCRC 11376 / JCM 18109 / NBRC 3775 / NCIMB 8073 / NRS 134) TaxID=446466 RepID=D5UGN1_CELFN|nr:metallophosphoesterase [Cellulomonas flavigena]ADG75129.1 metallophosphoesterase [Cellulomonas flavigena DSM 20109]